ncbi:MAG: hypothetical protein OXG35_15105 [Acidobacteria bacterium]|nr:hypothetical protein [Acidobacteriota bacterium]
MDATILAVIGTGLAGIGTATGLFVALWRVQQTGFDTLNRQMQNQFAAADKRWTERFEGIEKRFEMAETHNRERFEMAEKHNDAAHAAICERIDKLDQRTHADAVALNNRLDALHGRFDNLYRHLAGPPPDPGPAGAAPAG